MTISVAEMPSLVTLVCAAAGSCVSTTAPTARPNALNDFDIEVSSPWPILREGRGHRSFAISHVTLRTAGPCASRHRALAIHRVDLGGVALVHETPLQLHGRRQLLV